MSHLRIPFSLENSNVQHRFSLRTTSQPHCSTVIANMAEGAFGQICVMEGTVTFMVLLMLKQQNQKPLSLSKQGQFATSPPSILAPKVELSGWRAQFNINFWSEKETAKMFNTLESKIYSILMNL